MQRLIFYGAAFHLSQIAYFTQKYYCLGLAVGYIAVSRELKSWTAVLLRTNKSSLDAFLEIASC